VDVELLVVPDCPNQAAATGLVRGVLDDLGDGGRQRGQPSSAAFFLGRRQESAR
jgi:hypothetical protein